MEILPFLLWPFVASLILTGIHAYLGVHVVERGVIFVDLSLAQISMAKRFSRSGRWPLVTISETNSGVMSASGIP